MRILALTDLHGDAGRLEQILTAAGPVDLILFGGDITNFGTPDDVERLVRQAQAAGPTVLAVAGNCDSAAIDQRLAELEETGTGSAATLDSASSAGVAATVPVPVCSPRVGLHGRGVSLGSLAIHGLSGIPPWTSRMYGFAEEELTATLERGYAELSRVACHVGRSPTPSQNERSETASHESAPRPIHAVLTHVPPHGTRLDRTMLFQHVGSAALRAFVERTQPALVISGHVHEARGAEQIGRTTAVNCGPAVKGYYALIELTDTVNVDLRQV
jgi:Icc-related predicted phosphoesterase